MLDERKHQIFVFEKLQTSNVCTKKQTKKNSTHIPAQLLTSMQTTQQLYTSYRITGNTLNRLIQAVTAAQTIICSSIHPNLLIINFRHKSHSSKKQRSNQNTSNSQKPTILIQLLQEALRLQPGRFKINQSEWKCCSVLLLTVLEPVSTSCTVLSFKYI